MAHIPRDRRLTDRAKALRENMTAQERMLWYHFLCTYPVKFYRQRVIASFVADFYCAAVKLVIELDGSQHRQRQGRAYDAERDAIFEGLGLLVLRFSNRQIDRAFQSVCDAIHNTVLKRSQL